MDQKPKHVNKEILSKGIRIMFICLVLMFLSPTLIHIAFSNQDKTLFIPILMIGILLSIVAVYFLFKGIYTITDSIFGKRN